ncbi:MAG TPA: hypothetical protein VGI16_04725 [Candidatus Acidoferrum sp.]|jgi:hypothetical protein
MSTTNKILLFVLAWHFCSTQAVGQRCPRGPANIAELIAQMESTKDPNVILRAAAIGGPALMPELRKLAIPELAPDTVGGAAQASMAKLGDEATYAELSVELSGIGHRYSVWAIEKLLMVNTPRSISMILAYLDAHPAPITLGCEVDDCYDYVPLIFDTLADVVENAPIKIKGKYQRSREDWLAWSKHEKAIPFSISGDFQDPYEQCLGRKVEWGFDLALVDLGATGDQRAVPRIQKLGTMGYPYNGDIGSKAPANFIWLRHDYVETSLARLGDAKELQIIVAHLNTNSFQTEIQKLQIIGGKDAAEALVNSSSYFHPVWGGAFLKALAQMVESPPLPPDAAVTAENIRVWKDWWTKNKDSARFVKVPAFE